MCVFPNSTYFFSLLIDESTEHSTQKLLEIVIRHQDTKTKKIVDDHLAVVNVLYTKGEDLYKAVEKVALEFGIEFKNCVSFASDGAANVSGCNDSVWTRVKSANPDCVQVKCLCHSLAKVVEKAFDCAMPEDLCYLLAKIPSFFAHSNIRRDIYIKIAALINIGELEKIKCPFMKYCVTRWLSRGPVMTALLECWDDLILFFQDANLHATFKKIDGGRIEALKLLSLLRDRSNFIYLSLITPIVVDFERLNKMFQSSDTSPVHAFKSLKLSYTTLKNRVFTGGPVRELRKVSRINNYPNI